MSGANASFFGRLGWVPAIVLGSEMCLLAACRSLPKGEAPTLPPAADPDRVAYVLPANAPGFWCGSGPLTRY
ncbi:hypothetical protein ACFL5O_05940, partial [Myxococcota bacterium]